MRNYAGGIASGKVVALDSPYGGTPWSAAVKINHDGLIIVASFPSDGSISTSVGEHVIVSFEEDCSDRIVGAYHPTLLDVAERCLRPIDPLLRMIERKMHAAKQPSFDDAPF